MCCGNLILLRQGKGHQGESKIFPAEDSFVGLLFVFVFVFVLEVSRWIKAAHMVFLPSS